MCQLPLPNGSLISVGRSVGSNIQSMANLAPRTSVSYCREAQASDLYQYIVTSSVGDSGVFREARC